MLWYCKGCTAAYAPGAPCCPQCGGTEHTETPPAAIVGEPGPEIPADQLAQGSEVPADQPEPTTKRTRK